MKIYQSSRALYDMVEIGIRIAEDSPRAAEAFFNMCTDTFQQLALMPFMGVECNYQHRELKDLRKCPLRQLSNYLVFYRVSPRAITIMRIISSHRDVLEVLLSD